MKQQNLLILLGSIASVILLVLYFTKQNQAGGSVQAVYEVSGITPEVAAIRSQERIVAIDAKKDIQLGWLSYWLGNKQLDTTKDVALIESDTTKTVSGIEAEAAKSISTTSGLTAQEISRINADAQKYTSGVKAEADKYIAKQQADAAKKGKNLQAIFGGLGSVVSSVGKFFGL